MMTDEAFAREFVRRIKRPVATLTAADLIMIVEEGESIPIENIRDDIAIERLYSGNNVYQDVYKFVRDNQHLFIKEEKK